jgi:hypothetical protein
MFIARLIHLSFILISMLYGGGIQSSISESVSSHFTREGGHTHSTVHSERHMINGEHDIRVVENISDGEGERIIHDCHGDECTHTNKKIKTGAGE